jgi:hypothetical protein
MARLKRKHSKEGKRYRELGETEYRRQQGDKIRRLRRQARIDKIGKPETKQQKEQRTRIPSSTESKPLSSKEWHAKYKGGNVTQVSLRQYSGYLRNFGK